MSKVISYRVPDSIYKRLQEIANEKSTTVSALCRNYTLDGAFVDEPPDPDLYWFASLTNMSPRTAKKAARHEKFFDFVRSLPRTKNMSAQPTPLGTYLTIRYFDEKGWAAAKETNRKTKRDDFVKIISTHVPIDASTKDGIKIVLKDIEMFTSVRYIGGDAEERIEREAQEVWEALKGCEGFEDEG